MSRPLSPETQPHVLATVRAPRGKASQRGGLAGVMPLELVEQLMAAVVERTGLDPAGIDELVLGVASQTGEQGGNLARAAVLDAGWPATVAGRTVNRFCSSGLDAVATAAAIIRAGEAELVLAGGVESVSRVPMFSDGGPLWSDPRVAERAGSVQMGIAADLVATECGYERPQLDAYGARSQQRAAAAWKDGRYDASLVPVRDQAGQVVLASDEHVRPSVTVEDMAELPPAFADLGADGQDALALRHLPALGRIRHLHTRATSLSLADGAGLVLLGTTHAASRAGLDLRARVMGSATVGGDPVRMLLAGQQAVQRVLARNGLEADRLDVVEFAEAFAAVCLKIQSELRLADEVFNPNGGTIAMGHAFGATGAILTVGAVDELARRGGRYGMVAVSGAAGSGTALLLENAA